MMKWGRYIELAPDDLTAIRAEAPVIYLPWGALEWHGPHLPMGVDGIIAEEMAVRAAERTGGVVLPTTWWPTTALPHSGSLSINSTTMRLLWDDIFEQLNKERWDVVVVVSGHYSYGHEMVLIRAAEEAMKQYDLLVLAVPPLALVDETMLDHAALWETSLMLAIHPELVHLDALGKEALTPMNSAVLGQDPRGTASASMGKQALTVALDTLVHAIDHLLNQSDPMSLYALYEQRRLRLAPFMRHYDQGSLEKAIRAWWQDVLLGKEKK